MADGELGNLRRAPRIIEHKISKQSRYRTEGMAGGQFDAVIPVDVTDTISSLSDSASDGGGPVPEWFTESLTLTSGAAATWTLSYIPLDYSEVISLNGIVLSESVDYSITDNVVTWSNLADLILGIGSDSWKLTATYPYYDQASPPDPSIVGVYRDDGASAGNRTVTLPAAPSASNYAILVTSGAVTGVGGAFATWTKIRGDSSTFTVSIWTGSGVGSGSVITTSGTDGSSGNNAVVAILADISAVSIASIQTTGTVDATTGTVGASAVTAVVGDIVIGAVRSRNYQPTGVFSDSGFDSLAASAFSTDPAATPVSGEAAVFGLATATSVSASFGMTSSAGPGVQGGEAVNVALTWTPA